MKAGYRFGSTVVDVETDDPGTGAWLSAFLHPWADVVPYGCGATLVRMTTSAARFDAIARRRSSAAARPVACFALDSRVVALPGWDDGGGTVIWDEDLACYYRLTPEAVEVIAQAGHRRARVGCMRVVRERLAATALGGGGLADLHAAAFSVAGGAVLLVGPKGSGKTTLLIHALTSGAADLVANDRVFIGGRRDRPEVVGVPTVVSVRPWTLQAFPCLDDDGGRRPAGSRHGESAPLAGAVQDTGLSPENLNLSPAQLARRLGAGRARGATIVAIVFPRIHPGIDTWSLEPMPPEEGAARLRDCIYGALVRPRAPTVFEGPVIAAPSTAARDLILESLAARVPCSYCHLGPGAYRDGPGTWLRAVGLRPDRGLDVQ